MPCAPMMTAVLMPITSPAEDTSGPPELPGLRGASVCTTSSIIRPVRDCSDRPSAETTPAVTVASKPSGLPIAIAIWPRLSLALSPSLDAGAVGESETVGGDDHAGARAGAAALLAHVDAHHARPDALHHVADHARI